MMFIIIRTEAVPLRAGPLGARRANGVSRYETHGPKSGPAGTAHG